jgi:catalase
LGLQFRQFDDAFKNNPEFKRYVQSKVSRQGANLRTGPVNRPLGFATGGQVPGYGNTDTVPAMLTPGEFVLNRNASAKLGAQNLHHLNRGGIVGNTNYLANGGSVQSGSGAALNLSVDASRSMNQLAATMTSFVQASSRFDSSAAGFSQSVNVFAGNAKGLEEALNNMPRKLTGEFTIQHNINLNGAEVLAKLAPELRSMVIEEVKSKLASTLKTSMPDANIQVD